MIHGGIVVFRDTLLGIALNRSQRREQSNTRARNNFMDFASYEDESESTGDAGG
jgi:hypothetical protein